MPKSINEMFQDAGLTGEFASKAEVLFEATVNEKVTQLVAEQTAKLQESFDQRLEESKKEFIAEQAETFDAIVQEAIVEWTEKNSAALDASIKGEVLSELTKHLKEAFAVAEVLTPEGQSSLLESKQKEVEGSKAIVSELETELAESNRKLDAYERADIVAELTEGMSELAADRIAQLAVGLASQPLEQFRNSVAVLAEAFGGKVVDNEVKDGDNKKAEKSGKVNEGEEDDKGVDAEDQDDDEGDSKKDEDEDGKQVTESAKNPLIEATLAMFNRKAK